MSASFFDLLVYAGATVILFLTPGPVWVALTARALSGGFSSAWPLAVGVALGDIVWALLALLGMAWVVDQIEGAMLVMKYVAVLVFIAMGVLLIRHADAGLSEDSRLTKPGMLAGFVAGLAVIIGNPKAILFYMGVLPGFFDLTVLTWADIAAVCAISMVIPMLGNLLLAGFVGRIRAVLKDPQTLKRINTVSGYLLILVGAVIAFT
ncbi:MAG: LysE family translocator [Pseudomonadota bacterium]